MSDTATKLKDVFARVLEVDPSTINADSSPETLAEWDSLSHVQLIVEIEKAFNVSIAPDEAIEFENFQMIVDWLDK